MRLAERYQNPTILKVYASGYINNFLKHFQNETQHLGKCADLKYPDKGLFYEFKRGDKPLSELQDEMKRQEKRDKELAEMRYRQSKAREETMK